MDELVHSKEDVEKLGVMPGDFVCFDPRTKVTDSGFIKSRFLDDKFSTAILLGFAKYLKEENVLPERTVYLLITSYEEVGHGGSRFHSRGCYRDDFCRYGLRGRRAWL